MFVRDRIRWFCLRRFCAEARFHRVTEAHGSLPPGPWLAGHVDTRIGSVAAPMRVGPTRPVFVHDCGGGTRDGRHSGLILAGGIAEWMCVITDGHPETFVPHRFSRTQYNMTQQSVPLRRS